MDSTKQLGEEKISRLLIRFSVPAIIGMLVNALYNIVDRIFVGKGVGDLALSGVAIAFPIPLVLMAFGMLIGMGATALVSIKLGQNKREEAQKIAGNSFVLLTVICLAVSLLCAIFMEEMLILFGASEEVLPYARDFVSILLWGAVFQGVGFGMNNLIRAEGKPKIAMMTMLLGAGLNIILNPIFIFGLHMGVKGSALATVISQLVSCAWVLYQFVGSRSILSLRLKNLVLQWSIFKEITSIGFSPFIMQLVSSGITIILNKQLAAYGGDNAIAAMGVINSIINLIVMPAFGINQGAQPIIGYNYGARHYGRVKEALKLSVIGATLFMVIGFLFVELFPYGLMRLFSDGENVINLGAEGMRIYLFMLPVVGFQIAGSNYFQATGQPRISLFLSLSRQVIFLIPLILILPNIFGLGLNGLWLAGSASDFLSALVTLAMLWLNLKKLSAGKVVYR